MNDNPEIECGQVWVSRDPRDAHRRVRVEAVGLDGVPDKILLRNLRTKRHSTIRLASLPRLYRPWEPS